MIRNTSLTYANMKRYDVKPVVGPSMDKVKLLLPNGVAKILYALFFPTPDYALRFKCTMECKVAATRLVVACNAYLLKEGRLPDRLQTLLPTYLADIPNDPYDGKPFRYSSSMGIVYSVGKDLKDSEDLVTAPTMGSNQHSVSNAVGRGDDIVFEIIETGER
jgi:hypothetical protein